MSDHLLLPALGLCIASVLTAVGARLVERAGWHPTPPLWFLAVSLTTPLVWIAFQAVILVCILPDAQVHAGMARNGARYFREVVLGIGLKLWICGAVCTGGVALFKRRSGHDPISDARARYGLFLLGGVIAASIIVPMTMGYWIDHGRVNGKFALAALLSAFFVGLIPVVAASFALVRMGGARVHLRYAEPMVAPYAAAVAWRVYLWQQAVASRPGASAVVAFGICSLAGVLAGWFVIRYGNRAARAALARSRPN